MFSITTGRPATIAPTGMVASPHSLASAAGVDALRAGGSAVDAAIAAGAALSVLYPHMTSVGGDAFWLIYDAEARRVRREGREHRLVPLARHERNPVARLSSRDADRSGRSRKLVRRPRTIWPAVPGARSRRGYRLRARRLSQIGRAHV